MRVSQSGLNLIKKYEGLRLKSYKCDPSEELYTIGYGHYGVGPNLTITEYQAEQYLIEDLKKAEAQVNKYQNIYHFNQNQFDALVSFAYNIGSIKQLTADGTRPISVISAKIAQYNKCGGKILLGLVRRRLDEQVLFNTPVAEKTIFDVAVEVINGKWGNGSDRKKRLKEAGYDPKQVQNLVNQLLKV